MTEASFGGVALPNAGKISESLSIPMRDTLLASGAHELQLSTRYQVLPVVKCLGTWAQYQVVLALIGTYASLVMPSTGMTYTNCAISTITVAETDNPLYYEFQITFKQDTTP